ncbi:MAG: TrkA C-terminal domain-containing protein, partial [Firmicutes bacterium]|nr:TrkA C-terminal domain-containing protein [Bacillota bacterium]
DSELKQDNDWTAYLKRYVRNTLVYGTLMLACTILGHYFVLPLLSRVIESEPAAKLITLVLIYVAMALFIRPFLDTHSFNYTKFWVQGGVYRASLMGLTAVRVVLLLLIAFQPLHRVAGASAYAILPFVGAGLIALSKSGWLAARYINAEARFRANFNERSLSETAADAMSQMLDERLMVDHFIVPAGYPAGGKNLKDLGWGKRYDVNIIKIIRGGEHFNMPTGEFVPAGNDAVYVIGEPDNISTLYNRLNGWERPSPMITLREYMEEKDSAAADLYSFPILVDKHSSLAGKIIRDCGLRRDFDCMILGLQRSKLPIPTPDVHTVIAPGDQIWVLGTQDMADKLIEAEIVNRKE